MVGIQVRAYLRVDARRALAALAEGLVFSVHAVHVGRRSSQVTQVAFEVRHFRDGFYFLQDAFLASADDELSLMGRDGAEGAAAETAAVNVHRELDHLVRRNTFVLVFGMRQACVGQVERQVQFSLAHRRIRWIDYYYLFAGLLIDACGLVLVRFLFDVPEVFCLLPFVFQTVLVRMKLQVAFLRLELVCQAEVSRLRQVLRQLVRFLQPLAQVCNRLFSHTVDEQVGSRIQQDGRAYLILPIVVMRQSAEGCFDASQYDRYVGVQLFQYLGIDDARIFRSHVVTSVGCVGIFAAQALVGGVFVHHAVHTAGRYTEEETGTSQFLEVAQVIPPVGLGDNGYFQSL